MTKEQIFQSGFVRAFIDEYVNFKTFNVYPDKDRLLFILCDNDSEKNDLIKIQIKETKARIVELGFEELSYGYLLSFFEKNPNYIEDKERYKYWLERFVDEFDDLIYSFDEIDCAFSNNKDLAYEDDFWGNYPNSKKPLLKNIEVNISKERNLIKLIISNIKTYEEEKLWDFDFEDYLKYVDTCKSMEVLFNLCELLVQLGRLKMFQYYLLDKREASFHETIPTTKLKDLITHIESEKIVREIKIQYKNIKGKRLKLLLIALQQNNLLPKERIAQKFHDCCKKEFNWNIASYNAMNGHQYNKYSDNEELESMKEYIRSLIK